MDETFNININNPQNLISKWREMGETQPSKKQSSLAGVIINNT